VIIVTDPADVRIYPVLIMANIYYSYPSNRRGILRAVLSSEVARWLLKVLLGKYAGQEFPTDQPGQRDDFGVVRMLEGEANAEFQVGFYVLDQEIMHIEAEVRSCSAKLSPSGAR
jgi:hypothetical protein